jgi:hypothetical protein
MDVCQDISSGFSQYASAEVADVGLIVSVESRTTRREQVWSPPLRMLDLVYSPSTHGL